MPNESHLLFGATSRLPLARQLRPPMHRPVWSPTKEAVRFGDQGTGMDHVLAVPIAVAKTQDSFQMAWAQRPGRVPLTKLDATTLDAVDRNHTVNVGGASPLATHYWVLIWSQWVVPGPRTSDRPYKHPFKVETLAAERLVTLETADIEEALHALWRPDGHPGLIEIRRRP
jgi:hypothetical protein